MEDYLSYQLKNLIPLIGDEVFSIETNGKNIPLRSYVIDMFFSGPYKMGKVQPEEIEQMKTSGYYGITMLRKAYKGEKGFGFIYKKIVEAVSDKVVLHPTISSYIKTVQPRHILTTCPFAFENLFQGYKHSWFSPDGDDTTISPTSKYIWHIFGKAAEFGMKWVIGEEELLEFLHAWNNGKSSNQKFIKDSVNQHLLVLGCKSFPDWIFRFLWYPLQNTNTEIDKESRGYLLSNKTIVKDHDEENGQEEKHNISMSFEDFLGRIRYLSSDDMYNVLQKAIDIYEKEEKGQKQKEHDFFISYASEDKELVQQIIEQLEKDMDVWWDKGNPRELDGRYWAGIENAIDKSHYFMPIVTSNYIKRFFSIDRIEHNRISALEKETDMIRAKLMERYNENEDEVLSKIIPVLITGEKAHIFNGTKTIEVDLTANEIDNFSGLNAHFLRIFKEINFKYYSKNPEEDTFSITDWSIYKSE